MQTLADVFGLPIATVQPSGGAAYGAALLAAVGCGMFHDIDEAARTCTSVGGTFEPNTNMTATYNELYGSYRRLYPALKDEFAALADITTERTSARTAGRLQ